MKLHELYPDMGPQTSSRAEINVDIVLVHGLGGDYVKTWEAEDKTVWPKDLLPKFLGHGKIRVLSFDYGGSIKGTTSVAGIDDVANNLLQYLLDERDDERDDPRTKRRPVIFVGHSLGGVIIKRAIRMAYNNAAFKCIKKAILGVVFFATPHRGDWKKMLSDILQCNRPRVALPWITLWVQPTHEMVREVQQNPKLFTLISDDFVHLYDKLGLMTFQEANMTKVLGKAVLMREDGRIGVDTERNAMISGDHLSLCKFGGGRGEEERFLVVWKGIEEMIAKSPRQKERHAHALDSLCSDDLCQSMMGKKPMERTGEWIFERDEVKDWLDATSDKQRLWISGEPGCGKSYLAKHIIDKRRECGQLVICAFLRKPDPTSTDICRLLAGILQHALDVEPRLIRTASSSGESVVRDPLTLALERVRAIDLGPIRDCCPEENNVQGLLAATVRQVLDAVPQLIDEILIPMWEAAKTPSSWTLEALKPLWLEVMAKASAKQPVIAVIDGFEEMGRPCQEAFLEVLGELKSRNLRSLLLSREYPNLPSHAGKYGFARYTIKTSDTGMDITTAVNHQLGVLNRIHEYPLELRKKIKEAVPKAAEGIYLRADLMLGGLKRTNYSEGDLHHVLDNPPNGTAELYDHIFGRLWADEATSRSVKQVLWWVVFQREALSPTELSIARALGKARDNARGKEISYEEVFELVDENTELWVNRFCGHLVKLENGRFQLVHPSLREYLTTRPEQLHEVYGNNVELPYHADSYMDEAEGHLRLGNLCATYLAMPFFAKSARSESTTWNAWQAEVKKRMRKYKFLRYAALHWAEHLKLARDLAMPWSSIKGGAVDRKRQQLLEDSSSSWAESWAEVRCYFHDWHEQDYPNLCSVGEETRHAPSLIISPSLRKGKQPDASEARRPSASDKRRPTMLDTRQSSAAETRQWNVPKTGQPNEPEKERPGAALTAQSTISETGASRMTQPTVSKTRQLSPLVGDERVAVPAPQPKLKKGSQPWLVRGAWWAVEKFGLDEKPES